MVMRGKLHKIAKDNRLRYFKNKLLNFCGTLIWQFGQNAYQCLELISGILMNKIFNYSTSVCQIEKCRHVRVPNQRKDGHIAKQQFLQMNFLVSLNQHGYWSYERRSPI